MTLVFPKFRLLDLSVTSPTILTPTRPVWGRRSNMRTTSKASAKCCGCFRGSKRTICRTAKPGR